jgi:hypothetical protein
MAPERWIDPPRLPLVDPFDGVCEARAEPWPPDEATLKERCNFGYARGHCPRFPADAPWDAVRFTVRGEDQVRYVLEREYAPAGHGAVETLSGRMAAQAGAFAQAWRRRPRKEGQS